MELRAADQQKEAIEATKDLGPKKLSHFLRKGNTVCLVISHRHMLVSQILAVNPPHSTYMYYTKQMCLYTLPKSDLWQCFFMLSSEGRFK